MKRSAFISTLALCCLWNGSAFASEPTLPVQDDRRLFADLTVLGGYSWLDGNALTSGEEEEYSSVLGYGRVGGNLMGGTLVQFDLFGEGTLDTANADDTYKRGFGLAGHLGYRRHWGMIGVFGGYADTDQDRDATDSSERYFVGGESQFYWGRTTFYSQLGWLDGEEGDDDGGLDSLRETFFTRSVVRHFIRPDFKIEAEFASGWGVMDDGNEDDVDLYTWGLGFEKKLTANISGVVGYRGSHYEQDEEADDITDHTVRLGFRLSLDPRSLIEQDRRGASLDTPDVLRWMGQTGGPLE